MLFWVLLLYYGVLTWIVPAGEFDRVVDEASGRTLVVPGSYHEVEGNPVGLFRLLTLVQEAMIDSSGIIFFIFFAYAFVYMQMKCGAFDAAVGAMLRKLHEHKLFIIPLFMLIFGLCGSTFGMTEETFGLSRYLWELPWHYDMMLWLAGLWYMSVLLQVLQLRQLTIYNRRSSYHCGTSDVFRTLVQMYRICSIYVCIHVVCDALCEKGAERAETEYCKRCGTQCRRFIRRRTDENRVHS